MKGGLIGSAKLGKILEHVFGELILTVKDAVIGKRSALEHALKFRERK